MKFSVVIPTYRRHHYVLDAVDSVLAQTFAADEIIVVSDGPDPELHRLLDSRVRLLEPPHRGSGASRNVGIREAHCSWISFLDDDDLWHPEHLETTSKFLAQHPDAKAVNGPIWTFADEPGEGVEIIADGLKECLEGLPSATPKIDYEYLDITGHSYDALLERNRTSINTSTVHRDILLSTGGFPEGYTCAEDWVMAINVARLTEWHVLPTRTAFHRIHTGNNTTVRSLTNGLVTIGAIHDVWEDPHRPSPPHRPLESYGRYYRALTQEAIWHCLKSGRPDLGFKVAMKARSILPRPQDRLVALIPLPITWRLNRVARLVQIEGSARPMVGQSVSPRPADTTEKW